MCGIFDALDTKRTGTITRMEIGNKISEMAATDKTASAFVPLVKACALRMLTRDQWFNLVQGWINDLYSHDEGRIVSIGQDKRIRMWGIGQKGDGDGFPAHDHAPKSIAVNGNFMATTSEDCTVQIWDTSSCELLAICRGHERATT